MSCVFTALASGVAGASTLCVASPAGCLGTAFTAAQLQAALTTAAGDTDADTVMVGPGTFTGEFTMSSAGSVDEIVGSGVGVTTLTSASDNATTLTLQGGTVSALTLAHTAAPTAGYALKLSAGTARGIDARLEGSTVGSAVQLGTSGWVTGSTVRSNASGASGVTWTGGGNLVSDTQVVGTNTGYRAFGSAAADVTITIRRVRISGFTYGILVPDGTVNISDSLIDLGAIPTAIGIYQYNNAATASVIGLVAKRTTINGSGPAQEGIWGQAGNNTQVYTGTIADTVIRLVGASPAAILCTQSGGGVATMNVSHTAFKGPLSATGTCAPVVTGRIDTAVVDPLFRDAAAGDFRLQFTSPLVDVGTSVPAGSDRDVSGSARSVDGNNAGGAQPDIGAFEYQRLAPTVVVDAAATALVGTSVAYSATAADPQAEGALTYAWTFDDGTGAATGTTASHSFATAGAHLATVTVTAVNGQTTAVTRSVAITSPVVVDPPKPPIVTPPSFIGRITSLVKATGVFPRTGTAFRRPVRGSHAKRLTIKLNAAGSVKVTLARVVKRHVTPLKGSVTFRLPKGASAVEFGGRWGKGVLPAGAYRVTATLVKSKPVSARAVTLLLR
ncbi:MAG: Por secretion system C-terminal sorting protein [Thermoleophilia bacterium]|nr:Por secretion system C-terminal sorting protein [Thermoleophilia bacterium]